MMRVYVPQEYAGFATSPENHYIDIRLVSVETGALPLNEVGKIIKVLVLRYQILRNIQIYHLYHKVHFVPIEERFHGSLSRSFLRSF